MSDFLQPHELQHSRLLCPSVSPRVCLNSCSLSQWCHPTISSSLILFSFCLQSFLASGSFPMSQLFTAAGQSIGASASVQFSSVAQSCPTLCDLMDCSTPGFPVCHQTHVHWVGDAIQPPHPLPSPSPPALNLSQHQGPYSLTLFTVPHSF